MGRGLTLTGGIGLNLTNPLAAQVYADLGLSAMLVLPEVQAGEMAFIAPVREGRPVPTGALIYGHMPLMLTRACPLHNVHDCAHCSREGVLTDRKAKKVPGAVWGRGAHHLQPGAPLHGRQAGALPVDYGVAYFTLGKPGGSRGRPGPDRPGANPSTGTSPGGSIIKVQTEPAARYPTKRTVKECAIMQQVTVKYKVLDARAHVPAYATAGAAAADLCAVLDAPLTLAPMERALVPTGLAIELPDAGTVALVYARSGLSIKHGLCMANGVGRHRQRLPGRAPGAHGQPGRGALHHPAGERVGAAVHRAGVYGGLCPCGRPERYRPGRRGLRAPPANEGEGACR